MTIGDMALLVILGFQLLLIILKLERIEHLLTKDVQPKCEYCGTPVTSNHKVIYKNILGEKYEKYLCDYCEEQERLAEEEGDDGE